MGLVYIFSAAFRPKIYTTTASPPKKWLVRPGSSDRGGSDRDRVNQGALTEEALTEEALTETESTREL